MLDILPRQLPAPAHHEAVHIVERIVEAFASIATALDVEVPRVAVVAAVAPASAVSRVAKAEGVGWEVEFVEGAGGAGAVKSHFASSRGAK